MNSTVISSAIFAAAAVVMGLATTLEAYRAVVITDPFRGLASLAFLVLTVTLGYEAFAIDENKPKIFPTISRETALAFAKFPGIGLVIIGVVMITAGALFKHFTQQDTKVLGQYTGWIVIGVACVEIIVGGILTTVTHWQAL
jgi:hypothetical protein